MKDFVIKPGLYTQFKCGQRAEGLHLNRLIEDVMRENGYPTKSSDCTQPDLCELVAPCLSEIPGGNGVTEFTELTDTPNDFASLPGAILTINNSNDGLVYGPLVRESFGLNGLNIGFTPTIAPDYGINTQRVTRVGSQFFSNFTVSVPSFDSASQVTLNVFFSASQPSVVASLTSPTLVAYVNGIGTNTAIPCTITRQGGTVGSYNFEITFNAPTSGVILFVSIQAGT